MGSAADRGAAAGLSASPALLRRAGVCVWGAGWGEVKVVKEGLSEGWAFTWPSSKVDQRGGQLFTRPDWDAGSSVVYWPSGAPRRRWDAVNAVGGKGRTLSFPVTISLLATPRGL